MLTEFFDWVKFRLGGGLPKDLTTSGNFKVSIEESTVSSSGTTQYAEDTVSAAAESVVMVGVVRRDFPVGSLVDANGDRTELAVDTNGFLWVNATTSDVSISGGSITIDNAVGAGAVPIQDGGNSITIDGTVAISGSVTVQAQGTVATVDPTLTDGAAAALSITPSGRLRIDTEAGIRDFDGVPAIYVADRVQRRLLEQLTLEAYENSIRTLFLADSATSHRMGFEVR